MAGGVLVYLSCENIQGALHRVTANGGTVVQEEAISVRMAIVLSS